MPNYVTTRCTVTGPAEDIQRFRQKLIVFDSATPPKLHLDFNAVLPMPPVLSRTVSGSLAEIGEALIKTRDNRSDTIDLKYPTQAESIRQDVGMPDADWADVARVYLAKHPDIEEEGQKRLLALRETGYPDWYAWAVSTWGTKWNSGSFALVSDDPLEFTFDTAWSFPIPVFEKIAAIFPPLHFECVCYEEGHFFAGIGFFNPPVGEALFTLCSATDQLYERVYGGVKL